jgi:uncharacterized membrane protein
MPPLSLLHFGAGLLALLTAATIFALPKGSRLHRRLGWTYVGAMGASLIAILARTALAPRPLVLYAVGVLAVLGLATSLPRLRRRSATWRAWHGALMAFTTLTALIAMAGIFGGLAAGASSGPAFYRLFNAIIAVGTLAGLAFIARRPVLWGRHPRLPERRTRARYVAAVLAAAALLIAGQWPMMA